MRLFPITRLFVAGEMDGGCNLAFGTVLLGENLSPGQMAGILVTFAGVTLAILFGKRKSQLHQWESIKGPLWIGVSFGVLAALCQSIGSLIATNSAPSTLPRTPPRAP